MRADAIGLWWEDMPPVRTKGVKGPRKRGPMPHIPETGWRPASELPNLSAAKVIGFDTETWDPDLLTEGPGWGRGKGHIIGASLAVEDGSSWYFPIRHGFEDGKQVLPPTEAAHNMDPNTVLRYLDHVLHDNRPKVGANLIYDIGWLMQEGVRVGGRLFDIQFAEALLDSEAPDVSLEALAGKYLGMGKETSILYDWLASWCGGKASDRQRRNLFLSPPSLAGPYGEADAALPIRILERQWPEMDKRGVLELFDLECRLIPLLVRMRFRGAPVNLRKAEQFYEELGNDLKQTEARLLDIAGQPVNPNARDSLKSAFIKLGIPIPEMVDTKTKEKKISFKAPLLEEINHPLAEAILDYRRTEKVRTTFVKGYILDKNVNGRIHCSFHPLRGGGSGARSGRFSSSDPNLQNIPVRTEIGKRVRQVFEASAGARWRKWDYSQIEYRMLAHHAVGPGSEELRAAYIANPDIDYHDLTAELVKKLTGIELPRRNIKNINFGLIYGMSEAKLAGDLGLSVAAGKDLFRNYHEAAPFARATMEAAANEINRTGYVQTILGRKSDFTWWSKKGFDQERKSLPYELAIKQWGLYNIERSHTHKGLNRKLQGGAADVMKKAMVSAYEAGLFADDACGMPSLTVHDELDFEDFGDPDNRAWSEFKQVMETALPQLRVPIRIDGSVGPSWGAAD